MYIRKSSSTRNGKTSTTAQIVAARSFGHIWAIMMVWKELKISQTLRQAARKSKAEYDVVAHIQTMVMNRLDDPRSKLGLLSWLETVYLPTIDRDDITYPHLLRAMDFLIQHQKEIEDETARHFLTFFDSQLSLCFYDVTSATPPTAARSSKSWRTSVGGLVSKR